MPARPSFYWFNPHVQKWVVMVCNKHNNDICVCVSVGSKASARDVGGGAVTDTSSSTIKHEHGRWSFNFSPDRGLRLRSIRLIVCLFDMYKKKKKKRVRGNQCNATPRSNHHHQWANYSKSVTSKNGGFSPTCFSK